MSYKIGDKVIDLFNGQTGVITKIETIAGMETFFIMEPKGLFALYENEMIYAKKEEK